MAQGTSAAVNIDFFVRDTVIMHGRHRHCGECFVHFEKINIAKLKQDVK
jgi:hypothetical protein